MRRVRAEKVGSSSEFCGSFRCGEIGVCPFNVPLTDGAETFGGGGNGGGNFPRRMPLLVLSFAPPNPSKVSTKSVDLGLTSDLTSDKNSRSSPVRVNELRGEGDEERGRENRLRKRDTADPVGGTFASSSYIIESAGGSARLKEDGKLLVPEMTRGHETVGGTPEV